MKLSVINTLPAIADQTKMDLDGGLKLGPSISKELDDLQSMIKMLPNHEDLCAKLDDLRSSIGSRISLINPMIEQHEPAPTVLDYDPEKPLSQQRVHIHGVGSNLLGNMPSKVVREAGFVDDDIQEISNMERSGADPDDLMNKYKSLSSWAGQMARSATTLKNGINEITSNKQISKIMPGSRLEERHRMGHILPSIKKLRNRMRGMYESDQELNYEAIDTVMKQVCEEDGCTTNDLHDVFVDTYSMTPDEYAAAMTQGHLAEGERFLTENPLLIPAAVAALRVAGPRVAAGLGNLLRWSAKNPIKATIGGAAAMNPSDTATVVGGAVDAGTTVWRSVDAAREGIRSISSAMPENLINELARLAVQYAIPAVIIAATIYGGYKAIMALIDYMNSDSNKSNDVPTGQAISEIDRMIADHHVMEMYETMKIGLGDRAWVAITKRLKAKGVTPDLIREMVDRAIVVRS